MGKYFRKNKYQIDIISRESFKKWQEQNPDKTSISYNQFLRYWKHLRNEIFESVTENPAGVDLPFFLGNISIRVIDIDFNCAADFLKSTYTDLNTRNSERSSFVQSEIPKKIKIAWIKHKLFKTLPSVFGVEACRTMKKVISAAVREKGTNAYSKAFNHRDIGSKCEEPEEKSLF